MPNRALNLYSLAQISLFNYVIIKVFNLLFPFLSKRFRLFLHLYIFFFYYYLPPTQPFIPYDPIRVVEFNLVYSKFGLKLPLINADDSKFSDDLIFIKLPLYFNLDKDLDAVKRLVNLPLASNLTPETLLYLILSNIIPFKYFELSITFLFSITFTFFIELDNDSNTLLLLHLILIIKL